MPNKCDYCPTPIDWKKDAWIERHTPGKSVESAHEDWDTRGQEHLRMDCVFATPVTTRHTGGAPQHPCLAYLWPAVSTGFLAR